MKTVKRVKLKGTEFFLYGRFVGDECTDTVMRHVNELFCEAELELFRIKPELFYSKGVNHG